jgi:electron transport complex protein RnfC
LRTFRFSGGVHPHDAEKARTQGQAITKLPPPPVATILLQQHIGAGAKPIVKKGDRVLRGQMIAEPGGFVSVPYHSPVSGKVLDVTKRLHPLGMKVDAIVIENDGEDAAAPGVGDALDAAALKPKTIIEAVRNAGICGMGGAGFPTHVKLSPPPEKQIDVLIINGAECEPALSADHRLMLEEPKGVVRGASLLLRALERDNRMPSLVFAVEANKPDAASRLREAIALLKGYCYLDAAEVVELPVRYPQGAEKQLIYALTGRKVPPQSERGLPMDVGCVVQNVGTAFAVFQALETGTPLIERVVTVAGDAVGRPANFRARIGTPLSSLLDKVDLRPGEADKLILGGPMMGLAQFSDEHYVMKTTSGVLVERAAERARRSFDPCIRCARCVDVCPMSLLPTRLSVLAEAGRFDDMERFGCVDCIECGCCAYVCPARRPIVQQVKLGKWELAQKAKKAQAKPAEAPKAEAGPPAAKSNAAAAGAGGSDSPKSAGGTSAPSADHSGPDLKPGASSPDHSGPDLKPGASSPDHSGPDLKPGASSPDHSGPDLKPGEGKGGAK